MELIIILIIQFGHNFRESGNLIIVVDWGYLLHSSVICVRTSLHW